ncbi:MAG: DNA polymerase III subunit delta [Burkholderiales bacterium]
MRLTTEQLPRDLKRGVQPLYTVYGAETLLAIESADRIRASARAAGYSERELLSAESGFNWADLRTVGQSLSLFGSRRLIELRIPTGKPGSEGAAAIEAYARQLPPDTVTLVVLPEMDWRAVKAAWFVALEAAGVLVTANPVARADLPRWIGERLAAQGQSADEATLRFIADRIEGNLLAARQEVEKLGLLCPPGPLAFADVEQAVLDVARYDPFALGEALFAGDLAFLARMLRGLEAEGVAAPMALWAVADEVRTVVNVATGLARGQTESAALKAARVWGPRQARVARAARSVPLAVLEDALMAAAQIDLVVKGLQRGDAWRELGRLTLALGRAVTERGPRSASWPG